MEPRSERPVDTPTPFWGDPPDLPTCERWLVAVLSRIEDVQRDLSLAKDGATAFDGPHTPVPPEHFHAWRHAKIGKRDKLTRRYRWLKTWRRDALRQASGAGRRAALETVYATAARYVEVDDDASWQAFLAALAAAQPAEPEIAA